ncbi:nucleotide-diphospho-sugar transferase [Gorgonomyces haynaldii]|nr:nucleotide-diphospho-sugar transferase [Gorgonomyces haynaldii]
MSRCFVTLLTSDNYLPGTLVLAKSLRKHSQLPIALLIGGDQVSDKTRLVCEKYFDRIVYAPILRSVDHKNLELLGRPELDVTFTKLHVFDPQILEFERVCFLDSDVLVVQPIDDIFSFLDHPDTVFAAAPDIGWPDCFNSGVFVTKPSTELFSSILRFTENGSFDGGDQGLLNAYFPQWSLPFDATKRALRLPFVYNVTPTAFYSYLPALNYFKSQIRAIHFIGHSKPWKWSRFSTGKIIPRGDVADEIVDLVQLWWSVFDEHQIHKDLQDFVLDRDWSLYQHFEQKPKEKPHVNFVEPKEETMHYHWDEKEVEVIERRLSISSQRSRSRSPEKRSKSPNKSPERKSPIKTELPTVERSKSPEKRPSSPEKKPASPEKKPVYPTAHESMSRMISDQPPPSGLDNYQVGWNPLELKGLRRSRRSSSNSRSASSSSLNEDE